MWAVFYLCNFEYVQQEDTGMPAQRISPQRAFRHDGSST